jgi:hypothetical protein
VSANQHPDDLQPDKDEVLQAEAPHAEPSVPVRVAESDITLRTQQLPHQAGATFTKIIPSAPSSPVRILRADHRRAQATITSIGQALLFAFNNASAQDPSTMAIQPASIPLILTADCELWVLATTATTSVSVSTELWASGDSTA